MPLEYITFWIVVAVSSPSFITALRFIIEPKDQVVVQSQALWWDCMALNDRNQEIIYIWKHKDVRLPLHDNHVVYTNGTLLIKNVTFIDVGEYSCIATTATGSSITATVTLVFAYINATFSLNPASQTVFLGNVVNLSCSIESVPPAYISWTLNGHLVTSSADFGNGILGESILSLSPVLYSHAGTYTCIGTNPVTRTFSSSHNAVLQVQGQPEFLSTLDSLLVTIGNNAIFNCDFYGNPKPNISWYIHREQSDGSVNSKEISPSVSSKYSVYYNGTFVIANVTEDDEGYYTCTVGNDIGEMSESAFLNVTDQAIPAPPSYTSIINVTEWQPASLPCYCKEKAVWKKADQMLTTGQDALTISSTHMVHIGWYKCTCSRHKLVQFYRNIYLDVFSMPMLSRFAANEAIGINESIVLHCVASGNPSPMVTWNTPRFGLVEMPEMFDGITLYPNGSLIIATASLEDSGLYNCTAANIVGAVSYNTSLTIQVPPSMTLSPTNQMPLVGTNVYLNCNAFGIPKPTYTWSKVGEGQVQSSGETQIHTNATLELRSVKTADSGQYICTATNSRGHAIAMATVFVIVYPTFTMRPHNHTVSVGDSIQLYCQADGQPLPVHSWSKDGRQLFTDGNVVLSQNNYMLAISKIRLSQFGQYTCKVSNTAGNNSITAWINQLDIPVLTVRPENKTVNTSGNLSLQCQGQASQTPSAYWYSGQEGNLNLIGNIFNNRHIVMDGTLTIKNVIKSDEGWYTCILSNNAGSVAVEVYINVQAPPVILYTNSPQYTVIQSDVLLTCQTSGDPPPILQWNHPDGHVILESSAAYTIIGDSIQIIKTNEKDAGSWQCTACNLLGCDCQSLQVIIAGVPSLDQWIGSKLGDVVTLECLATGAPTPSVTFTHKSQSVTSDLEGHLVLENRLLVEENYLLEEYTCVAQNDYGTATGTATLPSQMDTPSISNIESSSVNVTYMTPVNENGLPLTGYHIQMTSDQGVTWYDVDTQGDLLVDRFQVKHLRPYTVYSFRVAAMNLMGQGRYSNMSPIVRTLSGVPSKPRHVQVTEVGNNTMLLSWQPSEDLHAPAGDVVYKYKVIIHDALYMTDRVSMSGYIPSNNTLQITVEGMTEPMKYIFSVWTTNTVLNLSSLPVILIVDMSSGEHELKLDASYSVQPDRYISIIFGAVAGILVLLFIVSAVIYMHRRRHKSKSMSLVNPTLSLDQFYMENPKSLYQDEKKLWRKSGISVYSFDEDSFHGSHINLRGNGYTVDTEPKSSDILLVSRSPLVQEIQIQSQTSVSSVIEFKSCVVDKTDNEDLSAIEMVNVTCIGHDEDMNSELVQHTDNNITMATYNGDQDFSVIYSSSFSGPSDEHSGPSEHFVPQIYSSTAVPQSSLVCQQYAAGNSLTKPPRKSLFEYSRHSEESSSTDVSSNNAASEKGDINLRKRDNRSASPKGSNSYLPRPPIKVLSFDKLKPAVSNETCHLKHCYSLPKYLASNFDCNDNENSAFVDGKQNLLANHQQDLNCLTSVIYQKQLAE